MGMPKNFNGCDKIASEVKNTVNVPFSIPI